MAFDKDWLPSIENPEKAVKLMQFGAFTAALCAAITAVVNVMAIYSGHPVLGMNGWGLVDAAVFSIVAWRVYRLSLPWAIAGLVLYTYEKAFAFVRHPGWSFGAVLAIFLFPYYLNAVRGGLYLRRAGMTKPAPAVSDPAPLEVKSVFVESAFEDQKQHAVAKEKKSLESSHEEYTEFLAYMKQGRRKFQRAGASLKDEFAAWLKDRRKRDVAAPAPADEVAL